MNKKKDKVMSNQYILPINGRWAVRGEETEEVSSIHDTQEEAIEAAKKLSFNSNLIILKEDGTMEKK
jgi:hypothetical protein